MQEKGNGWTEWKNAVLRELKQHDIKLGKIESQLNQLDKMVFGMKVKFTTYALFAGAGVSILIQIAFKFL